MGASPAAPLTVPRDWRTPVTSGDVFERFFAWHAGLRPVDATFLGNHEHDRRLPDWSPTGTAAWADFCATTRSALNLEGISELTSWAIEKRDWRAIDGALLDSWLETQLAESVSRHFARGNPSLAIGEAAFAIVGLLSQGAAPATALAAVLTDRLRGIPGFLSGALASLEGSNPPATWCERALRECVGVRLLLSEGLVTWCRTTGLRPSVADAVVQAAAAASAAVRDYESAIRSMGSGEPVRSCGREMLELLTGRGHWEDRSLDELLAAAREGLAEAKERLREMAGEGGYPAVHERLARLRPTRESYYAEFASTWNACRDLSIERDLVTWPPTAVRYGPIPAWARAAAPSLYYLHYRSPTPWPTSPPAVHEYEVPAIEDLLPPAVDEHLRSWNHSVIKLNHVVHHGALGHHVQNWHAGRAPSRIGRMAAVDCASRIAIFQGGTMVEGWACYATDLMDEAGFLTSDERVAEQHSRVRQLARAVVDIELHAGPRSFDRAVAVYIEDAGLAPEAARAEVVKNSMFPGTAMMYWLGTRGIHDLRRAVAARTGSTYSLRRFHDELLGLGSLPVTVVARLMDSRP